MSVQCRMRKEILTALLHQPVKVYNNPGNRIIVATVSLSNSRHFILFIFQSYDAWTSHIPKTKLANHSQPAGIFSH